MSYNQYGLIEASADYNTFVNGTNKLNTVLSTGTGPVGYGQTAISAVSAGSLVTATQWTTLFNGVNTVLAHQTNSTASNIATVITGNLITYISTLSNKITTAYTNAVNYGAQGTTGTGTVYSPNFTAANDTSSATFNITRTITFESADKARYFFNSGGQLNFVVTGVTNTGGTNRGASLATLAATDLSSVKIGASNNAGRTGSGGTLTTANANVGYYTTTTSNATAILIDSTASAYTSDNLTIYLKTNGTQGAYSDNGTIVYLSMKLFSGAQSPAFDDSIDITVNHRVDVIYPETTFLANTWGSVTIS